MVTPAELESLNVDQRAIFDRFPANLTRYLLLTKSSAGPYQDLGASFRDGNLIPRDRESVILRVGGVRHSKYEAMQHSEIARSVGVDVADVGKILNGSADFDDPTLGVLVAYVDSAVANAVTPEVMADLQKHFDDSQVAEIALLTGFYMMTAIFLQSLDVPLDGQATSWGNV